MSESSNTLQIAADPSPKASEWGPLLRLACQLTLDIPIPNFTVSDLLQLSPNQVINTRWLQGSDVPLRANGKLIGWTEFEVLDDHLAARMTQLA